MLTGKKLGNAIEAAIQLKGVTKKKWQPSLAFDHHLSKTG